jgi:NhaP-type Na+/H+ or K+/H+ antiporter
MIRGVIAFALCLQIDSKDKKYILTVALVIVMITTILGSSLIKKFIKIIGLNDENITYKE